VQGITLPPGVAGCVASATAFARWRARACSSALDVLTPGGQGRTQVDTRRRAAGAERSTLGSAWSTRTHRGARTLVRSCLAKLWCFGRDCLLCRIQCTLCGAAASTQMWRYGHTSCRWGQRKGEQGVSLPVSEASTATALFEVRCGPKHLSRYFRDASVLVIEVHDQEREAPSLVGKAVVEL
jgi:hypothetical protein